MSSSVAMNLHVTLCTVLCCHAGAYSADPLDETIAELEVDPLDALIAELERIEGHETTLRDAVANNKPIVVHPRPEVWAHEMMLFVL